MPLSESEEKARHAWARLQQEQQLADAAVATKMGVGFGTWAHWRTTRGYPRVPSTPGRKHDPTQDVPRFQILVRGPENGMSNRVMARRARMSYRAWMYWRQIMNVPQRKAPTPFKRSRKRDRP